MSEVTWRDERLNRITLPGASMDASEGLTSAPMKIEKSIKKYADDAAHFASDHESKWCFYTVSTSEFNGLARLYPSGSLE